MTDLAAAHDRLRPLMFAIAYRMLGSVAEAEDVVQDAFLRLHEHTLDGVESPDAYAATVATRLSIDALRSARRRRERYVGTWLPEPVVESPDADPAWRVEQEDTLSIAFLMLLERLSPTERAVFLLREVFGYEYDEIAAIVGRSEANCRQLFHRARNNIGADRPRFEPAPDRRDTLATEFLAAIRDGDLDGLERLLADDVVFYADGGGKAPAIREPLHGAVAVARFLLGLARLAPKLDAVPEPGRTNGHPAVIVRGPHRELLGVLALQVLDGQVVGLCNQINPDKLRHLGHVGDLTGLLHRAPRA